MATKTISITEDVYELLRAQKAQNESFSDEIRRIVVTKGSIMDLFGSLKGVISEEAAAGIKSRLRERRIHRGRLDEVRKKIGG